MQIFWLLVLAHFIGDFALQTDKIYFYKKAYPWGVAFHIGVYTAVTALLVMPFAHLARTWIALALLAVIHALLDNGKLVLSSRHQSDNLRYFLADQALHLGSIALLCWLLFDFTDPQHRQFLFATYLLDLGTVITATGLVLVTFAGAPLIYYIRLSLDSKRQANSTEISFPPFGRRAIGYIERLAATVGVILGDWFLLLLLSFLPRWTASRSRDDFFFITVDTVVGVVLCVGVGLIVRIIISP